MMPQVFDLTDRVAVVTGAAKGLGRAGAVGLAAFGADIAAIDLEAASCLQVQSEVERLGRRCVAYGCDVSDEEQVRRTVEEILAEFGHIDVLVNNAAIASHVPPEEVTSEQVRRVTEVNYHGVFWCCREVGKAMLRQRRGSIINMASIGGALLGMGRGNAAYCGSKGAVAGLTRDLACEWGPKGIRVNAIAPSWFQTDPNAGLLADRAFMEQAMSKLPVKRIGQPDDLIGPLVFLASDASGMVTGLVLPLDGGAAATCPIEQESK